MFKCSILSSRSLQVQVWVSYFRSTGSKDRHRKTRGLMCFDHNAQNRSSRGFNVEFFAGLFQVSYLRNVNHSSNIVETATRTGLKELGFPRPFRVSCLSRAPIRVLTVCHGDWNSDRPGKKNSAWYMYVGASFRKSLRLMRSQGFREVQTYCVVGPVSADEDAYSLQNVTPP